MIRKKDRSTFFTTNAGLCFVISASYSLSALSYLDFPYLIAAVSTLIEYIIILRIREMIGCCGFVCQCHKTLMQRSNVLSCDCANAWIGFVEVDADVLIRGAYTDWPGSTHDARVFRNFSLHINVIQGHYLDANSTYPLKDSIISIIRIWRHTALCCNPSFRVNCTSTL